MWFAYFASENTLFIFLISPVKSAKFLLMKTKLKILSLFAIISSSCFANFQNYYSFLRKEIGWKGEVVVEENSVKFVGITNLNKKGIADKYKVGERLSLSAVENFARDDIKNAESEAKKIIQNFSNQPDKVKLFVIYVLYIGANDDTEQREMNKMLAAINNKDYETARGILINSRWASYGKNRWGLYDLLK